MLSCQTLQFCDILRVFHVVAFGKASKQNNATLPIIDSPEQHVRYTLRKSFLLLSVGHIPNCLPLTRSDEPYFWKNWLWSDCFHGLRFSFQMDFYRCVLNRKAIHGLHIRRREGINGNSLFCSCNTIKQKPELRGIAGESFTDAIAEYRKERLFVRRTCREYANAFRRYGDVAALHKHTNSL